MMEDVLRQEEGLSLEGNLPSGGGSYLDDVLKERRMNEVSMIVSRIGEEMFTPSDFAAVRRKNKDIFRLFGFWSISELITYACMGEESETKKGVLDWVKSSYPEMDGHSLGLELIADLRRQ